MCVSLVYWVVTCNVETAMLFSFTSLFQMVYTVRGCVKFDGQAVVDCRKGEECRLLVRTDLRLFQHIFVDKADITRKNVLLQQNSKQNYQKVR